MKNVTDTNSFTSMSKFSNVMPSATLSWAHNYDYAVQSTDAEIGQYNFKDFSSSLKESF